MGQVLLVRHGQASWDAEDYDVLSESGWEQSRLLGRSLRDRGVRVDAVVRGRMRRHQETAEGLLDALPYDGPVDVDDGWDEFDHLAVLAAQPAPFAGRAPSRQEFQAWFEEATRRWTDGESRSVESFAAFGQRVGAALQRAAEREGTTLVVTSGGPVAWSAAALLAAEPVVRTELWHRLNPVCVNSGTTRVIAGRRGLTLVTFNEHPHLDGDPGSVTYR